MIRSSRAGSLRRLGGLLVLGAALAVGAQWLTAPANLPIQQVQMHGEFRHVPPAELERAIATGMHGNFLTQDLRLLEQRLEQHPWVAQARIRRVWPRSLRVAIVEQSPMAYWAGGGLLNPQGMRFMPEPEPDLDLVRIAGEAGREPQLAALLRQVQKLLEPHGLRVTRLEESHDRTLAVTVQPPLRLMLGRTQPLARLARWLHYREAYVRSAAAKAAVIDLRYPNGFAVRRTTES